MQRQPNGRLAKTGQKIVMVTEISATSTGLTATADEDNISFDKDHSGLVKYESRYDQKYKIVKEKVRSLEEGAVFDYFKAICGRGGYVEAVFTAIWPVEALKRLF
jgi:butyrate kinase